MIKNADTLVLIDSDFLNKVVIETKNGQELFRKLMEALDKKPVIHQYVYEAEVSMHSDIIQMVEQGCIKVIKYEDFLEEPYKRLYEMQFMGLYERMHQGEPLSFSSNESVFSYRKAKNDLGEIHTVLLANFAGIPIICSNDHGTKDLKGYLEAKGREKFEVLDVFDLIVDLGKAMKHTCISKEEALYIVTYSTDRCLPKDKERIKSRNKDRKRILNDLYENI